MTNNKRPRSNMEIEREDDNDVVVIDPTLPKLNAAEQEQYGEILEAMKRFTQRGVVEEREEVPEENETESNTKLTKEPSKTDTTQEANGKEKANGKKKSKKSRRQQKEETRNLIARLKALADRPELVDAWDVTARDPLLLVHLKSWPNTVEVPANWRQKRKYLQNKRGMEKRPFRLPSYIANTGVGALRDAQVDSDDKKTLKQKQREKMRAKTGRGVEIDEVVMHDAFFKFQTKPTLSGHGDLYYELRELEVDNSAFEPGVISSGLRAALGIGQDDPPPWLINLQRFGPPPGYPNLKIPGLNAPIPLGASFGYHPGGWGKPPVDITGRPIYGDVFGEGREYRVRDTKFDMSESQKKVLWGEIKKDIEFYSANKVDEDEDEEDGKDEEKRKDVEVASTSKDVAPIPATAPSGSRMNTESEKMAILDAPMEGIELRKGLPAGSLYKVLPEKKTHVGGKEMLGSSHVYEIGKESEKPGDGTVTDKVLVDSGAERNRKEAMNKNSERTTRKQRSFKF